MSESVTETPPVPKGKGKGAKLFGMDRTTVIVVGLATMAGLAYYIWKSRKSAGQQAANPNAQTGMTGECTDANGNPTPCEDMAGVDYAGQLSVLQTEMESLLAGQGTQAGGGTTTTTTPPPPPAPTQVQRYPAVSFTVKKATRGAAVVQFTALRSPTPVPTSYTVAAWQLNGKLASQQTLTAPDDPGGKGQVTINGLHTGWCYHVKVWANGGRSAPPGTVQKVCV